MKPASPAARRPSDPLDHDPVHADGRIHDARDVRMLGRSRGGWGTSRSDVTAARWGARLPSPPRGLDRPSQGRALGSRGGRGQVVSASAWATERPRRRMKSRKQPPRKQARSVCDSMNLVPSWCGADYTHDHQALQGVRDSRSISVMSRLASVTQVSSAFAMARRLARLDRRRELVSSSISSRPTGGMTTSTMRSRVTRPSRAR